MMAAPVVLAGNAYADGCHYSQNHEALGGLCKWSERVQNACADRLRESYANGTRLYRKGEHPGGLVPDGVQCHVFKKSSTPQSGVFNPSTCF